MSVEVFGLQDNAAGESAEKTRRAICFMLQRGASIGSVLGGVVQSTDLQVTYQGAGLKIETSPGEAIVPGNVSATESGYYSRNTAAATATLTAANGANPRIERISLVVLDAAYEGSENIGEIKVSVGTAKAGATLANLEGVAAAPKNSITLAYVLVPAGATTISNADIKNVAEPVSLGIGGLVIRFSTISTTVKPGELVVLEATGITATLSTQAVGCRFGVFCGINASSVKVKGASGNIYGDFVNGASSVTLTTFQHIELITEGINSLIVTGEPAEGRAIRGTAAGTRESFLSWGVISSAGAIEAGSGDYTVAKTGTGIYEIKWTKAKTATYAVIAASVESATFGVTVAASNPAAVVYTYFIAGSKNENVSFSFIVVAAS